MSESTAELAVHFAAAAHHADAAALCDSAAFMARVAALGPDSPGFVARVSAAVQEAAAGAQQPVQAPETGQDAGAAGSGPSGLSGANVRVLQQSARRAMLTQDYAGEITEQEVRDAEPHVVAAWATAGKLAGLGIPAQKPRGRRRA
ncbi:hypothetical protein [Streptacidiphilus carbonis]|uniref:hypothetical protein n=1 Tax=Streptacidiphilus carbonis TaxID=105422 RepID=UPI00126A0E94|nr:hypothetical protein [Streptacidiphilus carbonis]